MRHVIIPLLLFSLGLSVVLAFLTNNRLDELEKMYKTLVIESVSSDAYIKFIESESNKKD